jgi:4-hydroxyphenylpyruvate dioxygenase
MEVASDSQLNSDLLPLRAVHHVEIYAGNAKQSAYFYRQAFGFAHIAYAGPETGRKESCSYALRQDRIRLVLTSPIVAKHPIVDFLTRHGDGVRDIALETSDAAACYEITTQRGAVGIMPPVTLEDENGKVVLATVGAYGDTVHTFVETKNYTGPFLPGYETIPADPLARPVGLKMVDHIVGNMGWNEMDTMVEFYGRVFGLSRFVSFDDTDISTEYSALRSTVVSNQNKWIKFPINEPAEGLKKSQIEEYIEFNNGPGVQHIAMLTDDIIRTIVRMKEQGVEFLTVPQSYYDELPSRVGAISEDLGRLAELGILVDRDDKGYMLQLFTKPVEDRPTLFYEIIQRKGGESFGKGNFKALFESIEREQARRGNL